MSAASDQRLLGVCAISTSLAGPSQCGVVFHDTAQALNQ